MKTIKLSCVNAFMKLCAIENSFIFCLVIDYYFFFACLNGSFVNKCSVVTLLCPFFFLFSFFLSLFASFFILCIYVSVTKLIAIRLSRTFYFHKRKKAKILCMSARVSTHNPSNTVCIFVYFVGRCTRCYCMWTGVWGPKCKLADTTTNRREL